jgi:hypothetical protein
MRLCTPNDEYDLCVAEDECLVLRFFGPLDPPYHITDEFTMERVTNGYLLSVFVYYTRYYFSLEYDYVILSSDRSDAITYVKSRNGHLINRETRRSLAYSEYGPVEVMNPNRSSVIVAHGQIEDSEFVERPPRTIRSMKTEVIEDPYRG